MHCAILVFNDALSLDNSDDALRYLRNTNSFSRTIDELLEDVVAQILLWVPPHPRYLLMASDACKMLSHITGSNCFRNLTLSHHGGTLFLGFFSNSFEEKRFIIEHDLDPDIWETLKMSVRLSLRENFLACRNGRVLVQLLETNLGGRVIIWDPCRERQYLVGHCPQGTGTVLCSRYHGGWCTNSCHSANSLVVWISTKSNPNPVKVKSFSSDLGLWERWTASTAKVAEIDMPPVTLIWAILYWPTKSNYINAFDNMSIDLHYVECPQQTKDIYR